MFITLWEWTLTACGRFTGSNTTPRCWRSTTSTYSRSLNSSLAVHHTMRHIEKLPGVRHRVGPELSNRERQTVLTDLDDEIEALGAQLNIEHACWADMQDLISKMRATLTNLRRRVADTGSTDTAQPSGES